MGILQEYSDAVEATRAEINKLSDNLMRYAAKPNPNKSYMNLQHDAIQQMQIFLDHSVKIVNLLNESALNEYARGYNQGKADKRPFSRFLTLEEKNITKRENRHLNPFLY